jgi:hypothetical protein
MEGLWKEVDLPWDTASIVDEEVDHPLRAKHIENTLEGNLQSAKDDITVTNIVITTDIIKAMTKKLMSKKTNLALGNDLRLRKTEKELDVGTRRPETYRLDPADIDHVNDTDQRVIMGDLDMM